MFSKIYFSRDEDGLERSAIPNRLKEALIAHWRGDFIKSLDIYSKEPIEDIKNREMRDILMADRLLLSIKMRDGRYMEETGIQHKAALMICRYATAHKFFFIDQKRSMIEILRAGALALRLGYFDFLISVIFMIGHLLANDGKRRVGYALATLSWKYTLRRFNNKTEINSFATDSIFACYPSTLLSAGRLDQIQGVVNKTELRGSLDPYFATIFQASALYSYAYSGDVVHTELMAMRLTETQSGKMKLRYQPIARIMMLLPIAMRGYGYLLDERLTQALHDHDPEKSDPLINSQFYRALAVIYLQKGEPKKAEEYIGRAMKYCGDRNAFRSWHVFDQAIMTTASLPNSQHRIPDLKRITKSKKTHSTSAVASENYPLGGFLVGMMSALSTCINEDIAVFHKKIGALVVLHFGQSDFKISDCPVVTNELRTILKIGNIYVNAPILRTGPHLAEMASEISVFIQIFEKMISFVHNATAELSQASSSIAIARMTQMLAHDVRKPFSMLKTGLNMLQASSNDPKKFNTKLTFLVTEIERATKSVDGMLTDVMEIGSTSTELMQEPVAPESLIESTLGEIFRIYPKSKIALSYELNHSAMVHVHLKKIGRVFSNIVGNAVQAMNYSGAMWFKTKTNENFVEFCIGNAGSMIPQESLAKLFEAFFTSGKKGGTGLGLAIAQKVVQAHGGKIWCESSKTQEHPDGKVEFFFTLPIALGADFINTAHLPDHSDEITQMIALMGQASPSRSDSEFYKNEALLHQEVIQRARTLARPLGILIVDDESIYRSALAGWIEESEELNLLCTIHHARDSVEAFATLKNYAIDLIITDIDMGPKSLCGFDLVKELRSTLDFKGQIFVHSNRIVPDDHKKAGDLGASGFLPKPMAKGQLFKLFLQTIQWLSQSEANVTPIGGADTANSDPVTANFGATSNLEAVEQEDKSPYNLVAVIDDEDIFRDQWPAFLSSFDTVCYATAEDFVKDWDRVSGRLIAVLTDKYLGSGIDGIKLGTMLRQKAPDLAIFLSTSDMSVNNTSNVFDLIVDKDAFEEAPKITQYLQVKAKDESLAGLIRKTIRAFDSNVRDLDETHDVSSLIASHMLSWNFLLKDMDQEAKTKLKESMLETEKEKLKHDIKGSISRLKILLRNLESGDMDLKATIGSLESRVADFGKL